MMEQRAKPITLKDIENRTDVKLYVTHADDFMEKYGYTEHGFRHAGLVASISKNILSRLGFPQRTVEIGELAGYLHDIGNVVCRQDHEQMGALLSERILREQGMDFGEIALIMNAIGNHEEDNGWTASEIGAAVVIADKSDVHATRVRNADRESFDIHDRVNFAAKRSFMRVDEAARVMTLELDIDTEISDVMEYFEIFLARMEMCQRAAEFLRARFSLVINGVKLL
jgi:hypothetical protein